MANYTKFDDPSVKVDQSALKVYATPVEAFRRALQGITNRVLGGTAGTGFAPVTAGLTNGGTGGIKIANNVSVVINGAQGTCLIQDNLKMPAYTQPANTVAMYLVSVGYTAAGTGGTITGPGNVITKSDYATVALAQAALELPDLPDGHCALGYVLFNAPAATSVIVNSCGLLSTAGTAAYTDLICMPYDL